MANQHLRGEPAWNSLDIGNDDGDSAGSNSEKVIVDFEIDKQLIDFVETKIVPKAVSPHSNSNFIWYTEGQRSVVNFMKYLLEEKYGKP